MLVRCLALLLSLPFTASAASPVAPGPELLFELYARTLLEGDKQAAGMIASTYPDGYPGHMGMLEQTRRFVPDLADEITSTPFSLDLPNLLAERLGQNVINTITSIRCHATEDSAARDATARAAGKDATVSFNCRIPAQKGDRALYSDPALQDEMSVADAIAVYIFHLLVRDRPEQTMAGTARISGNADVGYVMTPDLALSLLPVIVSVIEQAMSPAPDFTR